MRNKLIKIIIISILVGLIEVLFSKSLSLANFLLNKSNYYLIRFLPVAAFLIYYLCSEKLFDHTHEGELRKPVLKVLQLILASFISHLFGTSVGKEGVGVEIGQKISNSFNEDNQIAKEETTSDDKVLFNAVGMAAGFSGIFLTPFAAAMYAIESNYIKKYLSIKKSLNHKANHNDDLFRPYKTSNIFFNFILIALASIISFAISKLFMSMPIYRISFSYENNIINIVKCFVIVFASIFIGISFNLFCKYFSLLYSNIKCRSFIKLIIMSAILFFPLYIFRGRYSGTGSNIVSLAFYSADNIKNYDFILKFILTAICLSIGYKGGKIMPLFAIGASFAVVLSKYLNVDSVLAAALGFLSAFAGGTGTIITPIVIVIEIFRFN